MHTDDRENIKATLAGDGEAYARLISRYQDKIGTRMWHFTRDQGTWEELVQDVFVEAYTSLRGFKGKAPFGHWLNRIATRVGYRFWKKRDTTNQTFHLDESTEHKFAAPTSASEDISPKEAADLIHTQLAQLPPRDRLVLSLIYLEQASIAEAAQLSGWSQSMVKVQAYRARKKLKRLLEKEQKND